MQTVKVPLANSVLYVSGTVNGVDKIWTREDETWWSTQAEKAADGRYRIALSIVYGSGQTVNDSVVLYYGLTLITDRTLEDVKNGTEKGFYNATDMNRVGAAMIYLRDRLNANGYNIDIDPKLDWRGEDTWGDTPDENDSTLYLSYVGTLRDSVAVPNGTPKTPKTLDRLTYTTANDIEKILEAVDRTITLLVDSLWYAGEIYSGEV